MGSVSYPSFSRTFTIYVPLNATPDDEFEAITIPDDSLSKGTIYEGDVVSVWLGLVEPTGLHAVMTPTGDKYVCFLVYKDDLVYLECNNDEYETEVYPRADIKVLGRVWQVYPGGDISQRWELIRAPSSFRRKRISPVASAR